MGALEKRKGYRLTGRPKFLLSGLVKCGECGGNYISHNGGKLRCSNHIQRHTCSNKIGVRRAGLEEQVLASVKKNMLQKKIFRCFMKELGDAIEVLYADASARRKAAEKRLKDLSRKISNIVEAVEEGQAHSSLVSRLGQLEEEKRNQEMELAAIGREKPRISLNMAEVYASKVRDLVDALQSSESDGCVREAIRDMVGQVTIQPGEGREYAVKVKGNIAHAFQASGSESFENEEDFKSWVQSIAGTGFVRCLPLLKVTV